MVSWWEIRNGMDADLAGVVPGWTPMTPGGLALEDRKAPTTPSRSSEWERTQSHDRTGEPDVDVQNQQGTVT